MLDLKPAGANDEDVVVAAPPTDVLSPAHDATPLSPGACFDTSPDFVAERAVPTIDTTFGGIAPEAFEVEDRAVVDSGAGRSWLDGLMRRAAVALLVMLFGSAATLAWRLQGDEARQIAARWLPDVALAWLPVRGAEPSGPPAALSAEAPASPREPGAQQPAPLPQSTSEAAAPPAPDGALQAMARDLEKAQQAIEQLKGNQDQLAREVARLGELAARHRSSTAPPRPASASIRKPAPAVPVSQAAIQPRPAPSSPAVPPTAPLPQLSSVPRPPAALP